MNIDAIRNHCLKKPGTSEDFPFDESTLVFRVAGKIFLLAALDETPLQINLKVDPEVSVELQDRYEGVTPGYHMNKKHWITVTVDGSIPSREVLTWIDHSYARVVEGLRVSDRKKLGFG